MNARSGNRLLRGQFVVYGLLVTLSVGLMGASGSHTAAVIQSDANYMLNPVEVALDDAADTVISYWSAIISLDNVRTENEQLRQENQTLTEELNRMNAISQLNTDWTKVSQAQQSSQYQTTIARVVVRNITDIGPRTFIINRGIADGISLGEVVMDDGGAVVGRILSVQTYDATVLLVNDTSAVVIGEEADSGAIGTIQGEISGLLEMSYVNSTDKLSKGQPVVTAGMVLDEQDVRSPYPPGLLIGTIISVSRDPNQVVQSALVQPAADLDNVDWVLVINNYQGGFTSPAPSASPSPSPSPSGNPKATPTPAIPRVTPTPGPTPTPPPGLVTAPPH